MWQITPITNLSGATLREQLVSRVGISASNNSNGIVSGVSGWERTNPRAYYTYEPGDLRRDWNIAPYYHGTGVVSGTLVPPLVYWPATASKWNREPGKWRLYYEPIDAGTNFVSTQAIPLLRYADVLLMLAEADNEINGPTAENIEYVNSGVDYQSIKVLGKVLLNEYQVPFEFASVLLLVSMIGAVLISKKEEKI